MDICAKERLILDVYFTPNTKTKSRWIVNLSKNLKLGNKLMQTQEKIFLTSNQAKISWSGHKSIKHKRKNTNRLNFIKINTINTALYYSENEFKPQDLAKKFIKHISNERCVPKITE